MMRCGSLPVVPRRSRGGVKAETGWSRRFDDAIVLPDGRKLVTLLDAAPYATKLPKKEVDTAEWQAAIGEPDAGRGTTRANDVFAHRHHEGIEPRLCSGV